MTAEHGWGSLVPGASYGIRSTVPPRDYLTECLEEWPAALALVRAVECRKLRRIALQPPILDVGCGTGVLAKLLFDAPLEAGIDVNAAEVAVAGREGAYRRTMVADVQRLPFPDGSFANVFSNCALEHVPNLDRALGEIVRVLRPGGALLATVPLPSWESDGPLPWLRRWGGNRLSDELNRVLAAAWKHVTLQTRQQWEQRLAQHGLFLSLWEPYMVPEAYAAHARYLLSSCLAFLTRRLLGRSIISRRLRRWVVPILASRLRKAYEAESPEGACAIFLACCRKQRDARAEHPAAASSIATG